ncbi:MAG: PKD domain-containing protein [Candidatus Thermoplasmatota archaeon]
MKSIIFLLCVISLFLILFPSYNQRVQAETTNSIIWSVTVNCTESGGTSDSAVFGEASDANDGPPPDTYDVPKAPAPPTPPYVRLWLNDSLPAPFTLLCKDYRHYPDTEKEWNVTVHWMPSSGSSPASVTLSWSIAEVSSSEYISVNLCNAIGVPLKDMLLNNHYDFNCPAYIPQNFKIICTMNNLPPATPQRPTGETSGETGVEYTYSTTTTDPNNDPIYYQWDWGDDTTSDWLGPYLSHQTMEAQHTWMKKGNYQIRVKARDVSNAESDWSDPLPITMPTSQPSIVHERTFRLYQIIQAWKTEHLTMIFLQIFTPMSHPKYQLIE